MSALADGGSSRPTSAPLGEILIERGIITGEQLAVALEDQHVSGSQLGAILVAHGFVAPTTIAAALATQHGGLLKTEYGFATGLGAAPEPPAPATRHGTGEVSALRLSPQLVAARAPAFAQLDAAAVDAAASPARDQHPADLTRECDELRAATAAASAELERLAAENARLAAQLAEDRDLWGAETDRLAAGNRSLEAKLSELTRNRDGQVAAASAEIERLAAENRTLAAQLDELTAERDAAAAAPESENAGLAARLAELELVLARVSNRGSTISERLDEVIGEVARLHEHFRSTLPESLDTG